MTVPHAPLEAGPLDPEALPARTVSERTASGHTVSEHTALGSEQLRREEMHRQQLRSTAAEVAAAIAHAAGTPLNVISGRVELIRQDPTGAGMLAQLDRIEEQVFKLADGLRELLDYLTPVSEPLDSAPAQRVLEELLSLAQPLARQQGVELSLDAVLGEVSVQPGPLLANLSTLVAWATRCVAALPEPVAHRLLVAARVAGGSAVFEISVPGLRVIEGWRLERFEARPSSADSEPYRTLSICAAIARAHGGKLQTEAAPNGDALRVRLLYPLLEDAAGAGAAGPAHV